MYYVGILLWVKEYIVDNMVSDEGYFWVFILIIVFGMGVNCKKVRRVIYFGFFKLMEMYV